MPNPSLKPVYMGSINMFLAFVWRFSYIAHSLYVFLACLGVILHQLASGENIGKTICIRVIYQSMVLVFPITSNRTSILLSWLI